MRKSKEKEEKDLNMLLFLIHTIDLSSQFYEDETRYKMMVSNSLN